jgi:hypothetical protein
MAEFTLQPGGYNGAAQQAARAHGAISANGTPIGSVEWTRAYAAGLGITLPELETYPAELWSWLGRKIRRGVFADAAPDEFVKPALCKAFTGALRRDVECAGLIAPGEPCWICEPVAFVAEWRCYILRGQVATWAQYGEGDDAEPDMAQVEEMLAVCPGPAGWALDVGRLADGRQVLVEANDGWALGFYKGADPVAYLAVIAARWEEMSNV